MNKFTNKLGVMVAKAALKVTEGNVNSTCMLLIHQPKLPKGSDKLRKF